MKIKLLKSVTIEGKTYPVNSVIDIYQPEWEAMIADGTGVAVPDGTMARLAAYDAPGCVPPQGPAPQSQSNLREVFTRSAVTNALNEPNNEGTKSDKQ